MTAPVFGSDPYSDRVVNQFHLSPAIRLPQPISPPESVAPAKRNTQPSERGDRRVSRQQLDLMRKDLSDRDFDVLQSVQRFRFLTTRQIERLHFIDHASPLSAARICRRVLARLHRLRVLEHLERRVGGVRAGSASYVWRVGLIGDRLMQEDSGRGTPRRRKEPSARHLDHCLAIADCYIAVMEVCQSRGLAVVTVETEPASWRNYLAASGARETLKPDLYVVTADDEFEDHWFIEIDRGTESLPTLISKCRQYERYRRSGTEQAKREVFPRVVWVMLGSQHAERLRGAIAADRRIDADLFRVTTTVADVIGGAE